MRRMDAAMTHSTQSLRVGGTIMIVIGLVGSAAASLIWRGTPPARAFIVAGLFVLVGLGLRIEAAIRERGGGR